MFTSLVSRTLCLRPTNLTQNVIHNNKYNNPLFLLRFASQIPKGTEPKETRAPIVDFLTTKCGLRVKKAISVSKSNALCSFDLSESVVNFFKENGFAKYRITSIISKFPSILLLDPYDNLKPKIDYFKGLGLFGADLAKFISTDPSILSKSLNDQIILSINFLKKYLKLDKEVVTAVSVYPFSLRTNLEKVFGPNIRTLENNGVPKCYISKLLVKQPRVLAVKPEKFVWAIDELKQKGLDLLSPMFVDGVRVLLSLSPETWEGKLAVYREFGFSDKEVMTMFRGQPNLMAVSEEKIRKGLQFFMKELKWDTTYVLKYPVVLMYSMEKRIIPRYAVLNILKEEGILASGAIEGRVFLLSEKTFLKRYVSKYIESAPRIEKKYQYLIC